MKTIIAPVDFSPAAENAAGFAASLAEFYGADLWLYHSYSIGVPITDFSYAFISEADFQNAAEFELEAFRKKVQEKLRRNINIHIKAENAVLHEGLEIFCKEKNADLVVMGLSGKNALTRLVVGSNTIKAIHHLSYPILVVPSKAAFNPVRKIGFACDYNHVMESIPVNMLKTFIKDFNADLLVLNIDHKNQIIDTDIIEEKLNLKELLKEIKPEFHVIESEDVTQGINNFAENENIDWMVMIPKKHKLLEKLFYRSHTQDMLVHTHIPILCMHQ